MQKNDFNLNLAQTLFAKIRFWLRKDKDIVLLDEENKDNMDAVGDISGTDNKTTDFFENPYPNIEGDPFLHSLEYLTPDDIAPSEPKKKRTVSDIVYGSVRSVLLLISIGVFCWSVYSIIYNLVSYKIAEDIYSDLASDIGIDEILASGEEMPQSDFIKYLPASHGSAASNDFMTAYVSSSGQTNTNVQMTVYNERFEKMKAKLNTLSIQNPDTYGWISIENTVLNYPIVQSEDNDFYLDHAFTGVSLPAGAIFADYRCYETLLENFHLILYGHNMKNGLMFNTVVNYLDKSFFDENPYIEVFTSDGIYTYEVFAIYKTRFDYDYIRTGFMNYDQFIEYAYTLKENSAHTRDGVEFAEGDRMLTLSTCTNGLYTERYALHAKLIKIEN